MGIILGLSAALAWGLADFCARFATHKIGNFRTFIYMQPLAFLALSLWLLFVESPRQFDLALIGLAALLGVSNAVAGLSLYRAFETGQLSVVAPIAATYGAVTLVLGMLSGQTFSVLEMGGLVVTIIGVGLAAAPLQIGRRALQLEPKPVNKFRGVGMALLASLFLGLTFWGLGYVTPGLGSVFPVWEARLLGPLVALLIAARAGQNLRFPGLTAWPWLVGVGILDTAALLFYNFGLESAESGIVSVLSSLFSAVTVLLASVFLKERLAPNQWLGVLLILAGVGMVSAG